MKKPTMGGKNGGVQNYQNKLSSIDSNERFIITDIVLHTRTGALCVYVC